MEVTAQQTLQMSITGCASHSSTVNEHEKVLDELEQWARDNYVRRNGKAGYFATYENIHEKIEQLRKQGKQES